jgi:hypothetical protein
MPRHQFTHCRMNGSALGPVKRSAAAVAMCSRGRSAGPGWPAAKSMTPSTSCRWANSDTCVVAAMRLVVLMLVLLTLLHLRTLLQEERTLCMCEWEGRLRHSDDSSGAGERGVVLLQ